MPDNNVALPVIMIYRGDTIRPNADYICGLSNQYILKKVGE